MRTPSGWLAALIASPALIAPAFAADNKIAPMVETVEVMHNGETVVIQRGHDPDAQIPEAFREDRPRLPALLHPAHDRGPRRRDDRRARDAGVSVSHRTTVTIHSW